MPTSIKPKRKTSAAVLPTRVVVNHDRKASPDPCGVDFVELDPCFSTGSDENSNRNKRRPVIVNRKEARDNTKRTKFDDNVSNMSECGSRASRRSNQRGQRHVKELAIQRQIDEQEEEEEDTETEADGEDIDDDDERNDDSKFEAKVRDVVLNDVTGELLTGHIKRIRDPISKVCRTKIEQLQWDVMPKLKCQGVAIDKIAEGLEQVKETVEGAAGEQVHMTSDLKSVSACITNLHDDLNRTRSVLKSLSTWLMNSVGNLDARCKRIENHLGCQLPRQDHVGAHDSNLGYNNGNMGHSNNNNFP